MPGLLERIERARSRHAFPVGKGAIPYAETTHGHDDSQYSPEEYGNYVVTSNEVFSAVSLRARLMSRIDLHLFAGRGADKRDADDHPAGDLLRRVNPFWTARRLARMDEMSMGLWGESYWAVEKGPSGQPSEIWWLKASRVTPVPHETDYLSGYLYEPVTGGPKIPFRPDEIVWFRYPNPLDEWSAISPLAAARLAADTASAMMKSNRNLFAQGMQLGGLVVPDTDKVSFTPEQAKDLEDQLGQRFKGVDKAHRWAVLRYEAQFRAMGVTPKDAEFVNGLGVTLRQVCNAYGIPAPLLNDLEHATLANAREFERMLWEHSLCPDADLRADEIAEQFLPMFTGRARPDHAAFDYSKVAALQESASEAWGRERQAIEVGRRTINEIRRAAGEPDVPWGDVWWAPVNKSAVTDATSTPQGDTSKTTMPDEGEQESTDD